MQFSSNYYLSVFARDILHAYKRSARILLSVVMETFQNNPTFHIEQPR